MRRKEGGREGGEREEGGSLKFKHIILRRSLGAPVSRSPTRADD